MGISCSGPALCNFACRNIHDGNGTLLVGLTFQAQRDMNAVDESFLVDSLHRHAPFIFHRLY